MPLQFQRWNVQKQINPNLKLIFESNWLPKNSFTYKGKKYPDKCGLGTASFNVWIKNTTKEI
ncbi:hypothetical protein ACJA25_00070 [Mycoplasmopsis hyopharyngis]|uniref:hypothetical protein n=1 Tax=Mycoplasmopsis hyopharyngis TaxID=29558 RepID=UPI0038737E28